jgi:hypothetical protein
MQIGIIIGGVINENENIIEPIIFLSAFVGALLFSTHYGVSINKKEKWILRSLNILGVRFGKKQLYDRIESCEIMKGSFSDIHMLGPFGIPSTGDIFHAFLRLSNGDMVEIGSSKDRKKLLQKINDFRFQLGLSIDQYEDANDQPNPLHAKVFAANPSARRGKDLVILSLVCLLFSFLSLIDDVMHFYISYWTMLFTIVSLAALSIGSYWIWKEKRKVKIKSDQLSITATENQNQEEMKDH